MYHAIGTPALGDELGLFSVTKERFHSHMKCLSTWQNGNIVDFSLNSLNAAGVNIAITFDDGYMDNLEVAAPILIELGLPFTIFVTTSFIKNASSGFLSPAALRELAALPGVQIGSHGRSHIPLTKCNQQELQNELLSSKLYLEDLLGLRVNALAYPYGSVDQRVRQAASEVSYLMGACSYPGVNAVRRDPLLLARTEINSEDDDRVFDQKLRGYWDWYQWLRRDPLCN
jgi:peptidoglycan/xylan/chitin deacetylase (PgdA/CDA1 family)